MTKKALSGWLKIDPFRTVRLQVGFRTRAVLAVGALGVVALAYACTLTDITGVPVGEVTIQPPSVTLLEGATVQLRAQATDQVGSQIPVGAVTWSIDDPTLLSVSDDGLVQALLAGQTVVRATLAGVSGSAIVTIQPGPTIVAGSASLSFLGAVGSNPPNPAVIQITNGGGGTLGGLSASVTYAQGGPAGWLNLSLGGTTAPTALTVSVLTGSLGQGIYTATISLSSQGARNSPITIPVQFQLTLDQAVIAVNPVSLEFEVEAGAGIPPAKPVQVTNVGGGNLTNLTTALVTPGSWLSANLSSTTAPAVLTVQTDPTGLAVGTYQGSVLVRSVAALNEEEVDVTLRVIPAPKADLRVAKTGPAGATVGDTVVFVVTVNNAGPDVANSVSLVDSLPSGFSFVRASRNGAPSGRVVTWSLGALASGTASVDSVWAVATAQGTVSNVARVSSTSPDPQAGNERATHSIQVVPIAANLLVEKSGPATAAIGENIQYVIRVVNGGPNAAENVVLIDSLPTGATLVSAGGGSVSGSTLTWIVGTLTPGMEFAATATVRVDRSGVLTNVANASSSTFDPVPVNNRAAVTTAVEVQADLSVSKTGPTAAEAGDTITYQITVTNSGPDDAANTTVLDSLPNGMTFISATGNGIQASGGIVSWNLPLIASGSSVLVTVSVRTDSTGTFTNVARAFSASPDPDSDDLRDTHLTIVTGADLSVAKFVTDDGTPAVGEYVTYTGPVDNLGPNQATGVAVTDTLPVGVMVVSTTQGTHNAGEGP
ncbi:MAG: Ig-like domain-containing protein, partial [Gemmatimonadota bacterium]